jgi:hypothetical protein
MNVHNVDVSVALWEDVWGRVREMVWVSVRVNVLDNVRVNIQSVGGVFRLVPDRLDGISVVREHE